MRLPRSPVALRRGFLALALVLGGGGGTGRADGPGCTLADLSVSVSACQGCHPFRACHPVDVEYGPLAGRSGAGLRSEAEVVKRGVLLPGGRLTCHSCHEAASPWAHRLALPPASTVVGAVDPRDPGTFEEGRRKFPAMTLEEARIRLPAGTALSPRPLCLACHAKD
jgi:hypothetical protein